jgi:hypothetical protein
MTPTSAEAQHRAPNWLVASHAYGLVAALVMGYFLLRIPIQIHDCFTEMCALLQPMGRLVHDAFTLPGYFRPGRWVFMKVVFDVSGGQYFTAFRTTQALQVVALVVLFVGQLRPRRAIDAALVPLGIAVLLGSHTFEWTVREAFPINHFLTIIVCCAAAVRLALLRHHWWNDVAAAALFVLAATTLESGLLVWVIVAGGLSVGDAGRVARGRGRGDRAGRGVLRHAIPGAGCRHAQPHTAGRPGSDSAGTRVTSFKRCSEADRSSSTRTTSWPRSSPSCCRSRGTGCGRSRPGSWGQPPAGAGRQRRVIRAGDRRDLSLRVDPPPGMDGRPARRRRSDRPSVRAGARGQCRHQLSLHQGSIMSPAGVLYAAAVFVAVRDLVVSLPARTRLGAVAASLVLLLLSSTWAIRWVGMHAALDRTAMDYRTQWARVDEIMPRMRGNLTPAEKALRDTLFDDAIRRVPARTGMRDEWTELFDTD